MPLCVLLANVLHTALMMTYHAKERREARGEFVIHIVSRPMPSLNELEGWRRMLLSCGDG